MKRLIIIAGLKGSGKTAVLQAVKSARGDATTQFIDGSKATAASVAAALTLAGAGGMVLLDNAPPELFDAAAELSATYPETWLYVTVEGEMDNVDEPTDVAVKS